MLNVTNILLVHHKSKKTYKLFRPKQTQPSILLLTPSSRAFGRLQSSVSSSIQYFRALGTIFFPKDFNSLLRYRYICRDIYMYILYIYNFANSGHVDWYLTKRIPLPLLLTIKIQIVKKLSDQSYNRFSYIPIHSIHIQTGINKTSAKTKTTSNFISCLVVVFSLIRLTISLESQH